MAEDKIDAMVMTIVAAVVGVIMLASFAIPTILNQVAALPATAADYVDLLKMPILFLVIGLILFVIRRYNSAGR